MFKILIVEDDFEKLRNVLSVIENIDGINVDEDVEHVVDSLGAKNKLKCNFYDLLIIDIAIPLRKSEKIDLEGGIKLLDEIYQRDIFKLPSHVIGLTAHEEIFSKAANEFSTQILSVIRYSLTDIEWQIQLKNGVEGRLKSKSASLNTDLTYDYDIAIIVAVDVEFQAIKSLSNSWNQVNVTSDASPYFETTFSDNGKSFRVIAACMPQMGMNASAVLSMKLIQNFRPKYLFMTGIAASVKNIESHGYGDILVIDEVWDGGAGKVTEDENGNNIFLQSASHLRLDKDISEKMRALRDNTDVLRKIKDGWKPNVVPNTELSIHIGAVASVAGVIENSAILKELQVKDRKLMGLEMETYGVYYSAFNCSNPKPKVMSLKSVCDFANKNKNDLYQNYAAYTSARVLYEFIFAEL